MWLSPPQHTSFHLPAIVVVLLFFPAFLFLPRCDSLNTAALFLNKRSFLSAARRGCDSQMWGSSDETSEHFFFSQYNFVNQDSPFPSHINASTRTVKPLPTLCPSISRMILLFLFEMSVSRDLWTSLWSLRLFFASHMLALCRTEFIPLSVFAYRQFICSPKNRNGKKKSRFVMQWWE